MDETGNQPTIASAITNTCRPPDGLGESLQAACRQVAAGRKVSRQIAALVRRFALSEAEFRLLWQLHRHLATWWNQAGPSHPSKKRPALDQTSLQTELALSAAQISSLVERMRAQGWIVREVDPGDRRRQWWILTEQGRGLMQKVLAHMAENRFQSERAQSERAQSSASANPVGKEKAA